MSKYEPQVGREFPLDEGEPGRHRRHHHHFHHRHGHHHHGHHRHGHHHHHGFGRLAFLLVLAGAVALIVEHRLTPHIALGLVAGGVALLTLRFALHAAWHWRYRRGAHNPVQVG